MGRHGIACGCHRILTSTVGKKIGFDIHYKLSTLVEKLIFDDNDSVKEASCVAIGAVLGTCSNTENLLRKLQTTIIKCMEKNQSTEVITSIANGLCIAVYMNSNIFEGQKGLPIINVSLKHAMHGPRNIRLIFNNFLWLALKVKDSSSGLEKYTEYATIENAKTMRSIYSNVLIRMKEVIVDI